MMPKGCWMYVRTKYTLTLDAREDRGSPHDQISPSTESANPPCLMLPPAAVLRVAPPLSRSFDPSLPYPTSITIHTSDTSEHLAFPSYPCSIASIRHRVDKSHSLPERADVAPTLAKPLLSEREGASSCDIATPRAAAFHVLNFNLIQTFHTLY
jgi:hypothetical protein